VEAILAGVAFSKFQQPSTLVGLANSHFAAVLLHLSLSDRLADSVTEFHIWSVLRFRGEMQMQVLLIIDFT